MINVPAFKYKQIPLEWEWLLAEDGPKMIVEGLQHYGILEKKGKGSNPDISKWAKELHISNLYTDDDIPWCGLFMAILAKRSGKLVVNKDGKLAYEYTGKEIIKHPLWARDWLNFGEKADTPMLGDVLVFSRGGGGHVGLYVGETKEAYAVLGGNQSNSVTITWILKNRLLGARRLYKNMPANVRVIPLEKSGRISTNEA